VPLFAGFSSSYHFIEQAANGLLYFRTDRNAPMGRIIAVEPKPGAEPVEIVAEQPHKLSAAVMGHGALVAAYLQNASDRLRLFGLDGSPAGDVALPDMVSLTGLSTRPEDNELCLGFTSFTHAPASYRYEFSNGRLVEFAASPPTVDPAAYETRQVWYRSKDGTRVSMFLVHRKDMPRDGRRPVLLTGYGGFNISLTPAYDPSTFVWLDAGGLYAVANLRGGGEYGEAWHEAGTFERKQNVFDDFVAAAEYLVAGGYTSPRRVAIEGGSNGGLLVGAVMVQRPDLWGASVCRVPVADMLRYHLFTVGRFWVSEYGASDNPAQFEYLFKYSPYHNVRDGTEYPPTLVMTADTDDRVDPGMAKKFAARLQAAVAEGAGPILIRIETRAGHGAGKPIAKVIDEEADICAFLFKMVVDT
jgi:prolyl oligopeptidase